MNQSKLTILGRKLTKKIDQAQKQQLKKQKRLLLKAQELNEKVENFEELKKLTE